MLSEQTPGTSGPNEAQGNSEMRFRQLLEKLPAGAYTCDAAGLITYFNQHAVTLWGREPQLNDPVDRFCGSFRLYSVEGQPIKHDQCWMALALQTGREFNREEIIVERPDGTRLNVLAHANPIREDDGRLVGAVNVLVDITEQKQMHGKLEEADRRKDEFLATLAHELRNPLAPISNSLHLLRLTDNLDPIVEHVRDIMQRQVGQLVRLVDDLLEVSRITRGKIELRKVVVELSAVVANAVETSKPAIEAGQHQLAISLPREPLPIEADPVRLAQVIANLLNNSAKYTPEGGQIWLSARRQGAEAVLSVRDTGLGIPADMLPRVFDLFAQVDRTLSRSQGGLGIGLSLARSFVELHGGRIEVFSKGPGQGTEFVVHLPLPTPAGPRLPAPLAAPVAGKTQAVPAPLATSRVLVVDDTLAAQYMLGMLLKKMGQEVRTAPNATTALEMIHAELPDIIISDIAMPHMDGYEFARQLRSNPRLANVTLVALTGYGQERDRQSAIEAGFDFHLVKPVSLAALHELLAAIPSVRSLANQIAQ